MGRLLRPTDGVPLYDLHLRLTRNANPLESRPGGSASQVTANIVWMTSAVSCHRDTSKQSTPIALTG